MRRLGGLVGVIVHQGKVDEISEHGGRVANDCDNSSKTWAQAYLYAVDKMQGGAVAIGSDFNGLAQEAGPRFGDEACHGSASQKAAQERAGARVSYPFAPHMLPGLLDRSTIGQRTFDYNTDGLAHIGMYPDFIQDLKMVGLRDEELKPLFSSAEAYIQMWERIERLNVAPPPVEIVYRKLTVRLRDVAHIDQPTTTAVDAEDSETHAPIVAGDVTVWDPTNGRTYRIGEPFTATLCRSVIKQHPDPAMPLRSVTDTAAECSRVAVNTFGRLPYLETDAHYTIDRLQTHWLRIEATKAFGSGVSSAQPAMSVSVADARTGEALTGTVRMNGAVVGKTGEIISYPACLNDHGQAMPCTGEVMVAGYPTETFRTP
jgi:hypothetical protein